MTGVIKEEGNEDTETHRDTERTPCKDGGRDWSDAATSQALPSATRSCKRHRSGSPLEAPRLRGPASTLTLA